MPDSSLPRMGLGTVSDNAEEWTGNVQAALNMGYRHIDTAQLYENEEYVGRGIEESEIDRKNVFLATKTVYDDVPERPTDVSDAINKSLNRLGVDYVDTFYVHWPTGVYDPEIVLPQYDDAVKDGKIDHVGVANFTPELLDEARELLDTPITAHQVEYHPLLQQDELLAYAQEHDHWLVAYCPVARGEVFDVPNVLEVAEKHGITAAQTSLAWLLSKDNVAVIPKSSSEVHMRENLEAADIKLDVEDITKIDNIKRKHRLVDPNYGPWNW